MEAILTRKGVKFLVLITNKGQIEDVHCRRGRQSSVFEEEGIVV